MEPYLFREMIISLAAEMRTATDDDSSEGGVNEKLAKQYDDEDDRQTNICESTSQMFAEEIDLKPVYSDKIVKCD